MISLADQIRGVADRVQGDLVRVLDYYSHPQATFRLLEEHPSLNEDYAILNSRTGTVIQLAELAILADEYITHDLAESVFQRLTSLLEDWVFGLLRIWLNDRPEGIPEKSKKPVSLADVLAAADKAAIIRDAVERELLGVAYRRPSDWFAYLNDRVGLSCPTEDQIRDVAEVKATRDVLAHNKGVVNAIDREKAGDRVRFEVGQRVEIPEPYLDACWRLIRDVVAEMAREAVVKASSSRGG